MNDTDTIADLQARLIQRTEQATATAYRDAETIRSLRAQLQGATAAPVPTPSPSVSVWQCVQCGEMTGGGITAQKKSTGIAGRCRFCGPKVLARLSWWNSKDGFAGTNA